MLSSTLTICAVCLWATPIWYPLYRWTQRRLGFNRTKRGRPRMLTPIDWSSTSAFGMFLGTILFLVGRAFR